MRDKSYDSLIGETQIFVYDININMLNVGKWRALERGKSLILYSVSNKMSRDVVHLFSEEEIFV